MRDGTPRTRTRNQSDLKSNLIIKSHHILRNGWSPFSNHIYIFVEDTIRVRTTRMRYEFQIEKRFIEHDLRH
jgi:hypothetical protein